MLRAAEAISTVSSPGRQTTPGYKSGWVVSGGMLPERYIVQCAGTALKPVCTAFGGTRYLSPNNFQVVLNFTPGSHKKTKRTTEPRAPPLLVPSAHLMFLSPSATHRRRARTHTPCHRFASLWRRLPPRASRRTLPTRPTGWPSTRWASPPSAPTRRGRHSGRFPTNSC